MPVMLEPSLRELLEDPAIHLLMRRDGVEVESLRRLIAEVRLRLQRARGEASRRSPACAAFLAPAV
jgi:hypothetical protein